MKPDLSGLATHNWQALTTCTYFGRLIIASMSLDGTYISLATAISGRSKGSQNRRYVLDDHGTVRTEVVDPTQEVGDSKLTLYNTQMETPNVFAFSNGCQTKDALSLKIRPALLGDVLFNYNHEPDKSIYTNRITGRCRIIRVASSSKQYPALSVFEFAVHSPTEYGTTIISSTRPEPIENGYSLFLATYDGDGDPPIRFVGGPRILRTADIFGRDSLVKNLSTANDFLVAVSIKTIEIATGESEVEIWNRHGNKPTE